LATFSINYWSVEKYGELICPLFWVSLAHEYNCCFILLRKVIEMLIFWKEKFTVLFGCLSWLIIHLSAGWYALASSVMKWQGWIASRTLLAMWASCKRSLLSLRITTSFHLLVPLLLNRILTCLVSESTFMLLPIWANNTKFVNHP